MIKLRNTIFLLGVLLLVGSTSSLFAETPGRPGDGMLDRNSPAPGAPNSGDGGKSTPCLPSGQAPGAPGALPGDQGALNQPNSSLGTPDCPPFGTDRGGGSLNPQPGVPDRNQGIKEPPPLLPPSGTTP